MTAGGKSVIIEKQNIFSVRKTTQERDKLMNKPDPRQQELAENYIRDHLPSCPLCKVSDTEWHFEHKVLLWEKRIEYTCGACGGCMSTAYGDMKGVSLNGLTDFLQGSLSYEAMIRPIYGKKKGITYVRIQDPGSNLIHKDYVGVEIPMDEIKEMSWKQP